MKFILLQVFTNYIDAHIIKGKLEASGIQCWLQDENISALIVDPILTNAIAGIKLMVKEDDLIKAMEILNESPRPLDWNSHS